MRLSQCEIGKVVVKGDNVHGNNSGLPEVGHIVGLTYNSSLNTIVSCRHDLHSVEVVPLVRWADGSESGVHPSNLKLL